MDIALFETDPHEMGLAIADYEKAIEMDPRLAEAYSDLGTARLHLYPYLDSGIVNSNTGQTLEAALADVRLAIDHYTRAIELDPQQPRYRLNRGQAYHLIAKNSDAAYYREFVPNWLEDGQAAVDLEPNNPWGLYTRAAANVFASQAAADTTEKAKYTKIAEKDWAAFISMVESTILSMEALQQVAPRIATLSHGPPILPGGKSTSLLGTIRSGTYQFPDNRWKVKLPKLMENSTLWDETTPGGSQVLYISDELARYYALYLLPASQVDPPGEEALIEQLLQDSTIKKEFAPFTKVGKARGFIYRDDRLEAECAAAVVPGSHLYMAAVYCLMDHYAGEDNSRGGIRNFAEMYNVKYEPVEILLRDFLTWFKPVE